jgi:hypothetical protein
MFTIFNILKDKIGLVKLGPQKPKEQFTDAVEERKTINIYDDNLNLNDAFMSWENVDKLFNKLWNQKNNHSTDNMSKNELKGLMVQEMLIFSKKNLNKYSRIEEQATENRYNDRLLEHINEDFLKECRKFIATGTFMPSEWRDDKGRRGADLTPNKLNIWENPSSMRTNGVYRYENQVPFWIAKVHGRNYDRENDGLLHSSKGCIVRQNPKSFKEKNGDFWAKSNNWV